MLIAWWRFNHPWKSSLSVGEYKVTRMDWHTISSIIPLDPDKWKYVSTYYPTVGSERDYHLVYNPTKNWNRHGYTSTYQYSTFWESKKMVIIQLSFFDYLKFRKYQRNKEKLAQQEEERENLKKDNEIKMMILENAQKDINKMREQAAKEVGKSAEYLRAAATSPHKPIKFEPIDPDTIVISKSPEEIFAKDCDCYLLGDYTRWQIE